MTPHWARALRASAATATGVALAVSGAGMASAAPTSTAVATTTVNIRTGAGTGHAVVGSLVRGQRITVTSGPRAGWVSVRFAGGRAYMAARYLDRDGRNLPRVPTRIATSGTKITTEDLNLRVAPSASSRIAGTLAEGRRLTLTGRLRGGYAETRVAGPARWVAVGYLASASRSSGSRAAPPASSRGQAALAFARRQLGKPYAFGAAGPSSYDCSGLTLASWRAAGVTLRRTSQQQYAAGPRIARSQLRPGDLVFFYSQSPSHVAIYAGNGRIIHSPRPGRTVEYSQLSYMPYAGAVRPG